MESESVHKPVLLREIIEHLNPKPGDQFIDATLNGGGHAMANPPFYVGTRSSPRARAATRPP